MEFKKLFVKLSLFIFFMVFTQPVLATETGKIVETNIVIIGCSSSGKTSFLHRILGMDFTRDIGSSTESNQGKASIIFENDQLNLKYIDTVGFENDGIIQGINELNITNNPDFVILVEDFFNPHEKFTEICHHLKNITNNSTTKLILVVSKVDDEYRNSDEISYYESNDFLKCIEKMSVFEKIFVTSSLCNRGIGNVLDYIIKNSENTRINVDPTMYSSLIVDDINDPKGTRAAYCPSCNVF